MKTFDIEVPLRGSTVKVESLPVDVSRAELERIAALPMSRTKPGRFNRARQEVVEAIVQFRLPDREASDPTS